MVIFLKKLSKLFFLYAVLTCLLLPQEALTFIDDAYAASPRKPVSKKKPPKSSLSKPAFTTKSVKTPKIKSVNVSGKSGKSQQHKIKKNKIKISNTTQKKLDQAWSLAKNKGKLQHSFNRQVFGVHFERTVSSARNYQGPKIMIGKYRPGMSEQLGRYNYAKAASQSGAKIFHVPAKIFNSWSPKKQWQENQRFLDKAIKQNSRVYLASPRVQANSGAFKKEVDYLKKNGYIFSKDNSFMYKNN